MNEGQKLLAMHLIESPKDPEAIGEAMAEINGGRGERLFHALMEELRNRKDNRFRHPIVALGLFHDMATISTGVAGYFFGRLQAYDLYDHEIFDSVDLDIFDYDSPEYIRSLMRLGAETSDLTWQSRYLAQAAAMRKRLDAAVERERRNVRRSKRS